jgi:hypothetical protein
MIFSLNESLSSSKKNAKTTAIGGPRLANILMIVSEIYLVLAVFIIFDHALCKDLKAKAPFYLPIISVYFVFLRSLLSQRAMKITAKIDLA